MTNEQSSHTVLLPVSGTTTATLWCRQSLQFLCKKLDLPLVWTTTPPSTCSYLGGRISLRLHHCSESTLILYSKGTKQDKQVTHVFGIRHDEVKWVADC